MDCSLCPALCSSRSLIVPPTWSSSCKILCLGEAPGADEDRAGEGFVGAAGKRLDGLMKEHGLTRNADYGVANIVRCRPDGNRKPTSREISNCLPQLGQFLVDNKPKVVVAVGATAVAIFYGAGQLLRQIEQSRQSAVVDSGPMWMGHEILKPFIASLGGLRVYPTVHTSGLSWNRKAKNGRPWSEIGREQIALAVEAAKA